jgi:hypothetical protein
MNQFLSMAWCGCWHCSLCHLTVLLKYRLSSWGRWCWKITLCIVAVRKRKDNSCQHQHGSQQRVSLVFQLRDVFLCLSAFPHWEMNQQTWYHPTFCKANSQFQVLWGILMSDDIWQKIQPRISFGMLTLVSPRDGLLIHALVLGFRIINQILFN